MPDNPSTKRRTFGQTLKHWLGRIHDAFPITILGALVGGLGAFGYFVYADDKSDLIVKGIALVAMAMVGLSLLALLITWPIVYASIKRRPSGLPESLTVGVPYETDFRCPRLTYAPFVQLAFTWQFPEGVEVQARPHSGVWIETVTPRERGRFETLTRRFVLRDIFGFTEVRFRRSWNFPFRIQPVPGRADVTLAIRRATDDGYSHPSGQPLGELVEMRRYAPGDPVRHILWKVFARSRRLMVREPERAIAPKPAMVGFFAAGKDDEASASTARLFLEKGLLGADFVFAAEGSSRPTSNVNEAIEQVIESRAFRDSGADSLAPLLRTVDRGRLDNLVVFAPPTTGPWVDKLVAASRRLPMPPVVVMTIDGQPDTKRRGRLKRLAFYQPERPGHRAARELPVVYDKLRQAGMELRVIHQGSGAHLDQISIDAWRTMS